MANFSENRNSSLEYRPMICINIHNNRGNPIKILHCFVPVTSAENIGKLIFDLKNNSSLMLRVDRTIRNFIYVYDVDISPDTLFQKIKCVELFKHNDVVEIY